MVDWKVLEGSDFYHYTSLIFETLQNERVGVMLSTSRFCIEDICFESLLE
jgi:hypothetical protein